MKFLSNFNLIYALITVLPRSVYTIYDPGGIMLTLDPTIGIHEMSVRLGTQGHRGFRRLVTRKFLVLPVPVMQLRNYVKASS